MELVPTRANRGRQTWFRLTIPRRLFESQAGYGGSTSLPVKPQALRKQNLLKPLFLVETEFHPEPRRVRQHVFGEGQHAVYVELLRDHVA
jgi:hypothetical protein